LAHVGHGRRIASLQMKTPAQQPAAAFVALGPGALEDSRLGRVQNTLAAALQ